MAYIQFHQALATHHKLGALCDELNVKSPTAAGHLAFVWCWALDNAKDGNLTHVSLRSIADAARWTRKPEIFVAALRTSGFICSVRCEHKKPDEEVWLHDWDDYAGKLLDRRKSDAERKRSERTSRGRPADAITDVRPLLDKPIQEQRRAEQPAPAARSNGYVPQGRPARWWYEHVMEKAPSPKIRAELDAIQEEHGFGCVAIVFTRAKEEAEFPWGWAKKVFESCATQGHWPREEPEERDRLQELAEKVL